MKIIEQKAEILDWTKLDLCERIEAAARICYRSEPRGNAGEFVRKRIAQGHLAVLEFARIAGPGNGIYAENARRWYERMRDATAFDRRSNIDFCEIAKKWPHIFGGLLNAEEAEAGECNNDFFSPANDYIPVLFTCNRAQSHQIVRHRLCSFAQESQRYCRYDGGRLGGQVEFIEPVPEMTAFSRSAWQEMMELAERTYMMLTAAGASPQQARLVLPNSTATRLVVYASKEEWQHIFSLRCDSAADPAMQALMRPLQKEMKERGLV